MMERLDRKVIAGLTSGLPQLGDPSDADGWLVLLRLLYNVGRSDLPLGRLLEGHIDAVQIISRYGSARQRVLLESLLDDGSALGVWNADLPQEPLTWTEGRLSGGKAYASGAGVLNHALLTVEAEGQRQLVHVDLDAHPPEIDRSWWQVMGMQRSETHIVRWKGADISHGALIGSPGDYVREPWFSGGAIRFAAVQAGGIAGLVDRVRDHLVEHDRAHDPHQGDRLAELYLMAQSAADAVANAARRWVMSDLDSTLAHVSAARVAVYRAGEKTLTLAQAAVGLQAMFEAHPLAAALTDLTVYLRQPNPDAQRRVLGGAVAKGIVCPDL